MTKQPDFSQVLYGRRASDVDKPYFVTPVVVAEKIDWIHTIVDFWLLIGKVAFRQVTEERLLRIVNLKQDDMYEDPEGNLYIKECSPHDRHDQYDTVLRGVYPIEAWQRRTFKIRPRHAAKAKHRTRAR